MPDADDPTLLPEKTPAELAAEASMQLRQQIEANAGAYSVGADARGVRFTFDHVDNFTINFLTVIMDGFQSSDEAHREMFGFALGHPFNVLGNQVRLTRSAALTPAAGFPQGAVLIWRGGHTPLFGVDADGVWSVQMTYCLLPPFAQVIG